MQVDWPKILPVAGIISLRAIERVAEATIDMLRNMAMLGTTASTKAGKVLTIMAIRHRENATTSVPMAIAFTVTTVV